MEGEVADASVVAVVADTGYEGIESAAVKVEAADIVVDEADVEAVHTHSSNDRKDIEGVGDDVGGGCERVNCMGMNEDYSGMPLFSHFDRPKLERAKIFRFCC